MIPMLLKLKIPHSHKPDRNVYLPLFLVWIFLLPMFLLLIPFIILGAILFWTTGYGRVILFVIPLLIYLLWNLRGLKIDIQDRENNIYMSFI